MRIVSYNIRKAVGLDGRRDPERVQKVLMATKADVLVLQEADRRVPPRRSALPKTILEAETPYRVADVAVTDVSLGWHGNAVLGAPRSRHPRHGAPAPAGAGAARRHPGRYRGGNSASSPSSARILGFCGNGAGARCMRFASISKRQNATGP